MEVLRDRELQDGPHLVLQNEEGKDTFVALSEPITIGRRTSNALQILDPTVSREHVRVSYGDGSGWVETWAAHTGRSSTTSAHGKAGAQPQRPPASRPRQQQYDDLPHP